MPIIIPKEGNPWISTPEDVLRQWAIVGEHHPITDKLEKLPYETQGDSIVIKQGDLAQFIKKLQPERGESK